MPETENASDLSSGRLKDARFDIRFALLVTLLFGVVLAVGMAHHEMYRDELQAWMIARDSNNVANLLHNIRYEGHPALYHLGLFFMSRLSRDPVVMQVYQWVLASAVVFVFARYAPFPRWQRALFAVGYFPLFEYGILSRSYVLGALTLFGLCALWARPQKNYPAMAALLALLANTSAYGLILTAAVSAALLRTRFIESRETGRPLINKAVAVSAALILIGMAFSYKTMKTPSDAYFEISRRPDSLASLLYVGTTEIATQALEVYAPFPEAGREFWNTTLVYALGKGNPDTLAAIGLLLLVAVVALLRGATNSRLLFMLGICGMALLIPQHLPQMRHKGSLFLLTLAALWLSRLPQSIKDTAEPNEKPAPRLLLGPQNAFLSILLIFNALTGLYAYAMDFRYPFSPAEAAARYITEHDLESLPMTGGPDAMLSAISGVLDKPIYYAQANRYGGFILWDKTRKHLATPGLLLRSRDFVENHGRSLVILIKRAEPDEIPEGLQLNLLGSFDDGVCGEEQFYLYEAHVVPHTPKEPKNGENTVK